MLKLRLIKDKFSSWLFLTVVIIVLLVVGIIGAALYFKSLPVLKNSSIADVILNDQWRPFKKSFGLLPFIIGTVEVVGVAVILAFPVSILTAVYITEFAPKAIRKIVIPAVDVLSGIPPVIYGVWGVLVIVPFIRDVVSVHFVEYASGYSLLSGGIVLGIMILPMVLGILLEVFRSIPQELRDSSLSVGASDWETVKFVLLKKGRSGIVAAFVLGVSRALGETIAVMMVCGNVAQIPKSLFDSCYSLPALIANNYGEMLSQPLYESALMLSALILFIIILLFNATSRFILIRLEKN